MKMSYGPIFNQNLNKRKERFPFSLKIIFFIAIILVALHFFAPQVLSSTFTMVVSPLWKLTPTDQEIEDMRIKLATNENRFAQVDQIFRENEELKSLLGRSTASTTDSAKKVLSQILKKPPLSGYDVFILDVGIDKNIQTGNKVYALGDIPIGEIAEINGNTSKVKLYSTPGEKFDVLIGKDNIQTTATGKGGGNFEVTLPHDTKIQPGDQVLIPSLTDAFVGTVGEIISEPSHPFSTLLFRQPFNIYELRWVLVEVK
jgi:cell shape-determining protein MreC